MSDRFNLALQVHRAVNSEYPYQSDEKTWNVPDFWEPASTARVADCEDYVLEKRARLMDAGIPPSDMRIGLVNLPNGTSHAVLVIRDGDKDWVADQTQPHLLTAEEMKNLGYTGQKLQVPGKWMWEQWKI